jgi:uncharacterized membrane protein YhiD involved in acid resistance
MNNGDILDSIVQLKLLDVLNGGGDAGIGLTIALILGVVAVVAFSVVAVVLYVGSQTKRVEQREDQDDKNAEFQRQIDKIAAKN